jgi:hypothetical protein
MSAKREEGTKKAVYERTWSSVPSCGAVVSSSNLRRKISKD